MNVYIITIYPCPYPSLLLRRLSLSLRQGYFQGYARKRLASLKAKVASFFYTVFKIVFRKKNTMDVQEGNNPPPPSHPKTSSFWVTPHAPLQSWTSYVYGPLRRSHMRCKEIDFSKTKYCKKFFQIKIKFCMWKVDDSLNQDKNNNRVSVLSAHISELSSLWTWELYS